MDYTNTPSIEIHQSAQEREKRLLGALIPMLRAKGYDESFLKRIIVKEISPTVYAVWRRELLSVYMNEKTDSILNLVPFRTSHYFSKSLYLAWYKEVVTGSQEKKVIDLYSLKDLDIKGNPLSGKPAVDKYSPEAYKAYTDGHFFDSKLVIETFKLPMTTKEYGDIDSELASVLTRGGAMRIRDLVILYNHKQVAPGDYSKAIEVARGLLLAQIADARFMKLADPVTKVELDRYLELKLIDQGLYTQAVNKLAEVEKARQQKSKEVQGIVDGARKSVDRIKP